MRSKKIKTVLTIFSVTTILTLLFIWGQSVIPSAGSAKESTSVKNAIEGVLNFVALKELIVSENLVRKLAHIIEYSLLGLQLPVLAVFSEKKIERMAFEKIYPKIALLPMLVAVIDETIQIFSLRGSQVSDIWIDFAGATFAMIISLLICLKIRKSQR